jgi:1,4-alpha-glucan branching enzyme
MAEDSSAFANLTRPPGQKGQEIRTGGLGFDFAWHTVFKYDTLKFWKIPIRERPSNFQRLLCSIHGADNGGDVRPRGAQILAYSHDENAYEKGAFLAQMAGDTSLEKFANGRMALAWQIMRGGGPVLDFMGNENLQSDAWDSRLRQSVENPQQKGTTPFNWEELDPRINPAGAHFHQGARVCRRDLNLLYLNSPGLQNQSLEGIRQVHTDFHNGVLCLHRKGGSQQFACLLNTSDRHFTEYVVPMPGIEAAPELDRLTSVSEVYNTDAKKYGGNGGTNGHVDIFRDPENGRAVGLKLCLPALTAVILEEKFS